MNFIGIDLHKNSSQGVRARSLLVEAAWAVLRWKTERTKAPHEWWARIAQRRGCSVRP